MQIKASIKKELLYFAKTFRMYGAILAMILLAFFSIVMIYGMNAASENIDGFSESLNESVYTEGSDDSGYIAETTEQLFSASVEIYFAYGLNGITGTSLLILMLIMMKTAGGELKKKNMIIPNCSGLSAKSYVIPKMLFYAVFTFVSTAVVALAGYFLSSVLADASIPALNVACYIGANSLFCTFIIVLYLFCGLATGKAGLSVILIYVFINIFPTIMEFADVNKYNPISLMKYSLLDMELDKKELLISAGITAIVCALLIILTTVLFSAKKINNARKAD